MDLPKFFELYVKKFVTHNSFVKIATKILTKFCYFLTKNLKIIVYRKIFDVQNVQSRSRLVVRAAETVVGFDEHSF